MKIAIILGLLALLALVAADDTSSDRLSPLDGANLQAAVHTQWSHFRQRYQRTYSTLQEAAKRFRIFVTNIHRIRHHNQLFANGSSTFQQRANQFADLSATEVAQQRNGFNASGWTDVAQSEQPAGRSPRLRRQAQLPSEVNWVQRGAVTAVTDQGQCGSCWAITVAAAMEALHFRHTGQLVPLSAQQLLDCTPGSGNSGCNGGNTMSALQYVRSNGGLGAAANYGYRMQQGTCYRNPSLVTVQYIAQIPARNERDLMVAVANYGPVTVAIDSSQPSFHFYSGGVYQEPMCRTNAVDHSVLVVGYGRDAETGLDYWLVKNSWGAEWGEQGYVRIARNVGVANCCIACYAVYPAY